jgi:GNAT superfamily N-acetyltransferase
LDFVDLAPGDPRLVSDMLPVLRELRTELTARQLVSIYAEGYQQGLRFTAVYDGGRCIAAAGWRLVATTAVGGRKLYIDDLVVDATVRSRGYGRALLAELTGRARAAGCTVIDLDSATFRTDAHRFYMRERLAIHSFHFGRKLGSGER